MTETVREHFNVKTACWRDLGGCTTFHAVHVHVDFDPPGTGTPKCGGGSDGFDAPGSPALQRFLTPASEGGSGVEELFPEMSHGSGFDCKKIANTDPPQWSQHAFRNAVDLMVKTTDDGFKIFNWLNGPHEEEDMPDPRLDPFIALLEDLQAKKTDIDTIVNKLGPIAGQDIGFTDGMVARFMGEPRSKTGPYWLLGFDSMDDAIKTGRIKP